MPWEYLQVKYYRIISFATVLWRSIVFTLLCTDNFVSLNSPLYNPSLLTRLWFVTGKAKYSVFDIFNLSIGKTCYSWNTSRAVHGRKEVYNCNRIIPSILLHAIKQYHVMPYITFLESSTFWAGSITTYFCSPTVSVISLNKVWCSHQRVKS